MRLAHWSHGVHFFVHFRSLIPLITIALKERHAFFIKGKATYKHIKGSTQMKLLFLASTFLSFFFTNQMFAETVDLNASSLESPNKYKNGEDYQLSDEYPLLQTIDLDDITYKSLNLDLSGSFPVLHSVHVATTSGAIRGKFVGHFNQLTNIDLRSSSGEMRLDFNGSWEQSCNIQLASSSGAIYVKLPKEVNVLIKTHTASGRIKSNHLKLIDSSSGEKTYANDDYKSKQGPTLIFDIETSSGQIILN